MSNQLIKLASLGRRLRCTLVLVLLAHLVYTGVSPETSSKLRPSVHHVRAGGASQCTPKVGLYATLLLISPSLPLPVPSLPTSPPSAPSWDLGWPPPHRPPPETLARARRTRPTRVAVRAGAHGLCMAPILDAPCIPASPSRNDPHASCPDQGSVAACSPVLNHARGGGG